MDSNPRCFYCNKTNTIHSCTSCAHTPLDFTYVLNSLYKIKPSLVDSFIKSQPSLLIMDAIMLYNKNYQLYEMEHIPIEFSKMKKMILTELVE